MYDWKKHQFKPCDINFNHLVAIEAILQSLGIQSSVSYRRDYGWEDMPSVVRLKNKPEPEALLIHFRSEGSRMYGSISFTNVQANITINAASTYAEDLASKVFETIKDYVEKNCEHNSKLAGLENPKVLQGILVALMFITGALFVGGASFMLPLLLLETILIGVSIWTNRRLHFCKWDLREKTDA